MAVLSLRDLAEVARERLDPAAYDYFAGGADDEVTLRANEDAYGRIGLVPRVLRGIAERRLDLAILGCPVSLPVVIAPTAFHRLAHPDGELATARAAAAAGTVFISSMAATTRIEEVTETGATTWFQLYVQPDRGFTEALVRRVETAGCRALVITVDSPVFGRRERDLRNGFVDLPEGLACENLRELGRDGTWGPARDIEFVADLDWSDIDRLREMTDLPLVLKGITHPDDAQRAIEHGAAALCVSNHGGRQLDTVPATLDLLPAIAHAVDGRVPVLLDGGIRRGTDVVKACALGASAVGIGRPVLWGLAVDGQRGVEWVLEALRAELDRALALCGYASPGELDSAVLRC
jgi:4-hydroxymandelate oxidase